MKHPITIKHTRPLKRILVALLALSLAGWMILAFVKSASPARLRVQGVELSQAQAKTSETIEAQISIGDLNGAPATNTWIGLKVNKKTFPIKPAEITEQGFYTLDGANIFLPTDRQGRVNFKILSSQIGKIEYQIVSAEITPSGRLITKLLGRSFILEFIS